MKYGRSEDEWGELTRAAQDFLAECGQHERLTSYSELNAVLAERVDVQPFDFTQPSERAAMGHLLFRVVDATAGDGFMLSALVVYLDGNDAGSGFYTLAADLGLLQRQAAAEQWEAFWTGQVMAIFAHYATR